MSTALVFGANGISGLALISHLSTLPSDRWKKIIALSRRQPTFDHDDPRVVFKSVDLLGPVEETEKALREAGAEEADHVFFYAYVAKEDEGELIDVNKVLFSNALEAVAKIAPNLKSFQLQTGYKCKPANTNAPDYGTHKGGDFLAPYPWKESSPRHSGDNFYFVQEDLLSAAADREGWTKIITRPNFVIGASKGNYMSLATSLALYAIASRELGQAFVYPGGPVSWELPYDHSIASHDAAFQVYLAEKGLGGTYNIAAGEPVRFKDLWPKIAEYFNVQSQGPPVSSNGSESDSGIVTLHSVVDWAKTNQNNFPDIASKLHIDPKAFDYATWDFVDFATSRTWKDEASLDKAHGVGWTETVDVWEGFKEVFGKLEEYGVLPRSNSKGGSA